MLRQAHLHHRTPMLTLLHPILQLGTSGYSMSSNLFGPYWQKGEKHMSLIVFKRVHMGGCFIFCFMFTTLVLKLFGSWVVTLKLDGRLLLLLLLCDAMINSAWSHSADVHFSFCISFSSFPSYMHDKLSSHFEEDLHKYNLPCAFAFKSKLLIYTSSGEPFETYEENDFDL